MEEIIKRQREYFNTGATLNYKFRINQLKCIKNLITEYQSDIVEAFGKDYNKCEFDVYSTEIGMTVHELDYLISHLKSLMRPKRKCTSVINFPSKGYIVPEPYGVVLVVAPWNYPFQLSILPMIGAIAAGNTVILKLSANTPNISAVISSMLSSFPQEYIYTTWDNLSEREQLFEGKYDYIFYTGSTGVARTLMEKQGRNIVPVTLELGGKSPCIIDRDANIDKSAKRVVWGKFLNAGQTCVAPDYVVIERSIKEKWLESALYYIDYFYYEQGTDAVRRLKEDFPWLVTRKSVDRLLDFCNNAMVLCGGRAAGRLMEPTIINDVSFDDPVMKEEIFGPVLPILTFDDIDDMTRQFHSMEKPLALYYFGRRNRDRIISSCSFGGGCVNDTIMHLTEQNMPFGGVGHSGMGSYHGRKTFDTFTHYKSVLSKNALYELSLKYQPYTPFKLKLTKKYFGL